MNKLKPELEKRFNEKFPQDGNISLGYAREIKQFLAQALADQKQEFIKKIEEMKKFAVKGKDIHSNYMTAGYNSAIYRIIKLLQKKGE
ncbi:MAG: DUF735 family protein [Patescibacteria group bacterium]|nr:DUF735 family protein [Patescibacteria group bacterium]